MKEGCEIRVSSDFGSFCEEGRRRMYWCWIPSLPGIWFPQVHSPCAHNMVAGLMARTMAPTPTPTPEGLASFHESLKLLKRVIKGRVGYVEQWEFSKVVSSYKEKRMRVRYEQAERSLSEEGLCTRKDSEVKAFVKAEKLSKYKLHKPRVIMGRSPRYNLELASYLKPIEHALYGGLRGFGRQFFTHTRLIGKGLSPSQRAALIRTKFEASTDLAVFEVDGKSWESHFTLPVLQGEHSVYHTLCSSPRLKKLLSYQLEFIGRGEGVTYKAKGIRASGDFNTGLGNTIVMVCLMLMVARCVGKRFDFLADGDNAILFVKKRDLDVWRNAVSEVALGAGFEMTLENPVETLEEIVFGQSKPLFAAGAWTMVRDPLKTMSHALSGHRHYGELRGAPAVLRSVGQCEAHLSRGVPVLQEFAHAILRSVGPGKLSRAELGEFEYRNLLSSGSELKLDKAPISNEAREGFERAWGVCPEVQLAWEKQLSGVKFTLPTSWSDIQLVTELPDGRDLNSLVSHSHRFDSGA